MDVVQMFWNVKRAFDYVNGVDLLYKLGQMTNNHLYTSCIKEVCDLGETDLCYWKKKHVNFSELRRLEGELVKAELAKDFVSIYDIMNFEVQRYLIDISDVLFQVNGTELREHFWKINQEALRIRYPNILEEMETIQLEEDSYYTRPYGTRGKVVCKRYKDFKFDLYSGYNPTRLAIQMLEKENIKAYRNLHVWGCNGGYEINGFAVISDGLGIKIKVYVTDLGEFKKILSNTPRRGVMLHSNIEYEFHVGLKEFIEKFDLQKKEDNYIYVCESGGEDLTVLKHFIHNNFLNSNIGE